jgi:hypothetical protein
LAKLIRLLSSNREGEIVAAATAIKRVLKENDLDFHTLADMVAGGCDQGATNAALQDMYQDGYRAGYRDAGRAADGGDDTLSWREVARFCLARSAWLKAHERDFVEQMVGWTARGREPSSKQARWLDYLYVRLQHRERK